MTSVLSIAKPITLKTTKEINGFWGASMQIIPDDYIGAENYVDIDGEEYVVKTLKKIKSDGKYYYDVSLYHNGIEELSALTIARFSLLKSVSDLLTWILTGTGWTAGVCDIDETVSLVSDRRSSVLEALNLLTNKSGGELYFHSKTRVVDLKREIGTVTGLHLRYDKNCNHIEKEEDSTNLITRIYPSGPDNYLLNTTVLDDCEDEGLYAASGAGTKAASTIKRNLTQGIQFSFAVLNETFIRNLGEGGVVDLTGHDTATFFIYSATDNTAGVTFGIGESAYTENTVNSGALTAGCWHEISLDLSGVAAGDKNAIRYIGFKNLTNGVAVVIVDTVRAFGGTIYIDSANKSLYKVNKEYAYFHSAKVEKTQFEIILYPTDDAAVSQEYLNTNYGSNTNLTVKNYTGYDWIPYLKWSLADIPIGATIVSATIGLTCSGIYNGGEYVESYLLTSAFDESTVTYNNKPTADVDNIYTFNMKFTGLKEANFTTTVQGWFAGTNYGIKLSGTTPGTNKASHIYSKENSTDKPYLKIVYTLPTDPNPVIDAAARAYLADHEEPILRYKVKVADLSKAIVDTWEDETIELGDTVKIYDAEMGINVNVRVKKITEDLLHAENIYLELANKVATIADIEALKAKQLSYAMPYKDNDKIVEANAVQTGYFGSDVNV